MLDAGGAQRAHRVDALAGGDSHPRSRSFATNRLTIRSIMRALNSSAASSWIRVTSVRCLAIVPGRRRFSASAHDLIESTCAQSRLSDTLGGLRRPRVLALRRNSRQVREPLARVGDPLPDDRDLALEPG